MEKALLMDMIAVDTAATAPICDQQQSRIRTSALHIHGMQGGRAGGGSPSPSPLQLTVPSIPLRSLDLQMIARNRRPPIAAAERFAPSASNLTKRQLQDLIAMGNVLSAFHVRCANHRQDQQ